MTAVEIILLGSILPILVLMVLKWESMLKNRRFLKFVNYGGIQFALTVYLVLFYLITELTLFGILIILANSLLGLYFFQIQYFGEDKILSNNYLAELEN